MNIKLDLSKFKHLHSDDHTTTLQHKTQGHTITLAHQALPKEHQAQLQALAKMSQQQPTTMQEADDQDHKMASGGKVAETNPKLEQSKKIPPKREMLAGGGGPLQKVAQLAPLAMMAMSNGGKVNDATQSNYEGMKRGFEEDSEPTATPAPAVAPHNSKNYETHHSTVGLPQTQPDTSGYAKGGEVCEACGGPVHGRKMYASSDNYVDLQDNAPQAPAALSPNDPNSPSQANIVPDVSIGNITKQQAKDVELDKAAKQVEAQKNLAQLRANAGIVDPNSAPPNVTPEQQQINHLNELRKTAGLPPKPLPPTPPQPDAVNQPQPDSQDQLQAGVASKDISPADQPKQSANLSTDPGTMMDQGFQNAVTGNQAEAQQMGKLGEQNASVQQQGANAEQTALTNYQSTFKSLNDERLAHINDIKSGMINPDKYWTGDPVTGEGGHSKIAAGIGMILAGFNPTSHPNAAIDFLKYQMNKNIEAQQHNLSAKQNLLTANLHQFGNIRDATDMTRIMQNDTVQHMLAMNAAKAQGPLAQAAAQKAIGALQLDSAEKFMSFGMRRAMMNAFSGAGGGAQDPATYQKMHSMAMFTNPELAKQMNEAYVPGVGMSSSMNPVPEAVRQQIVAHKSVNDLMNTALQFSAQHKGTLDPSLRAQAATIQNQLIGQVKQAQHDGVYKQSEADFLTNQIGGSPASFLANFSSVPKIKQMQAIKQQEYGNLLKTYGLPMQQLPRQSGSGLVEGATGTLANGTRVKVVNGKITKLPK